MYFCSKSTKNAGGFDSPAPLNDNGFALDPFGGFFILQIKVCGIYQIQKLHAVVIHELIVLTPKIIVQQRKLITIIFPLFLDFLSVLICGTKLHTYKPGLWRRIRKCLQACSNYAVKLPTSFPSAGGQF